MGSLNTSFIPMYKRLFDLYKNKIISQEVKPGHQIDSINRIMQKFDVSRETSKAGAENACRRKAHHLKDGQRFFCSSRLQRQKKYGE